MANAQATGGGLSLPVVLTIIFVVLKLIGVITWSWLWVLSPLWIAFLIGLVFWGIAAIIIGLAGRRR